MEQRRQLPQQIRAIGLLGKEPATIGFRTAQLSQAYLDKPFGLRSKLFQFAHLPAIDHGTPHGHSNCFSAWPDSARVAKAAARARSRPAGASTATTCGDLCSPGGTATEKDVIWIRGRERRLFELVDDVLVEKVNTSTERGQDASTLAARCLRRFRDFDLLATINVIQCHAHASRAMGMQVRILDPQLLNTGG